MADRQIILTGSTGRLGMALRKILPAHTQHLLGDFTRRDYFLPDFPPGSILIHCAAMLAVEAERDHLRAWAVNVEGTRKVARAAAQRGCRMVYISSDYVFGDDAALDVTNLTSTGWEYRLAGIPGAGYRESDEPKPINFYGKTKRAGELITLESPNNLALRAPFRYGPPWAYDNAFDDQWTSARWIGEVAPDIAEAALSDLTGILHVGGPRRNLHEFAESAGVPLRRSKRADWPGLNIPMDTSLDSSRWKAWKQSQVRELVAR